MWGGAAGKGASITYFVNVDVTQNNITLVLTPENLTGTLTLQLVGPSGNIDTLETVTRTGGSYNEVFEDPTDVPTLGNLVEGEYTQVNAIWNANGVVANGSAPYHIKVLGLYNHTQYNTPNESSCPSTTSTPVFLVNEVGGYTNCVFTTGSVLSQFLNTVTAPGSGTGDGISISYGLVSEEQYCTNPTANKGTIPPTATPQNTLRTGGTLTGSCDGHTGALNNSTVAYGPGNPDLSCDNRVFISGYGVKTVTDTCPGCVNNNFHHLDNYTTNPACTGIPSLTPAGIMTIKLY